MKHALAKVRGTGLVSSNVSVTSRRKALALLAWGTLMAGCGGGSGGTAAQNPVATDPSASPAPPAGSPTPAAPAPTSAPAEVAWNVGPIYFALGGASTFDLASTLPAGVQHGGTFGIDPSGENLPAGMALSDAGMLSLGTAAAGEVVGVMFTYAEPVI